MTDLPWARPYARPHQPLAVKKVYALTRKSVGKAPTVLTSIRCPSWGVVSGGMYK